MTESVNPSPGETRDAKSPEMQTSRQSAPHGDNRPRQKPRLLRPDAIANTNRVRIEAEVDEFDAGRIRLGRPVKITAEGYPGQSWRGVVEEVPNAVSEKNLKPLDSGRPSDVRVLRVKIAFKEPTQRTPDSPSEG
jgi:hypothetical protein